MVPVGQRLGKRYWPPLNSFSVLSVGFQRLSLLLTSYSAFFSAHFPASRWHYTNPTSGANFYFQNLRDHLRRHLDDKELKRSPQGSLQVEPFDGLKEELAGLVQLVYDFVTVEHANVRLKLKASKLLQYLLKYVVRSLVSFVSVSVSVFALSFVPFLELLFILAVLSFAFVIVVSAPSFSKLLSGLSFTLISGRRSSVVAIYSCIGSHSTKLSSVIAFPSGRCPHTLAKKLWGKYSSKLFNQFPGC